MPAASSRLNTPLRRALLLALLALLASAGASAQAVDPAAPPPAAAVPAAPATVAVDAPPGAAEAPPGAAPVVPDAPEVAATPSSASDAAAGSTAEASAAPTADAAPTLVPLPAGAESLPPPPSVPAATEANTAPISPAPAPSIPVADLPAAGPPSAGSDPVPFAADADAAALLPAAPPPVTPVDPQPAVATVGDPAQIATAPTPSAPASAQSATTTTPLPATAPAAAEALAPTAVAEAAGLAKVDPLAATLAPTPSAPPEMGPPSLIAEGDPTSPSFIGPPLVPPMKLLEEEVAPGSKRQLMWSAGSSFAGGDSVAPVNVVRGTRPGPVLCLTAAIHGDELNGVEIVRRILNDVNPDRLSGTVIAVPIVNMFGFTRNSRYLPDRRDLNRFFPGSQRGSIASRIAYSFFNEVARHCDYLVDFHTGSFERDNLPQVRADLRLPEVLRFARGFGALPVLHSDGSRGMLRVAATQVGIPSVTFEVGAPGVLQVAQIDAAAEAIDALAHHLGMVPDAPPPQDPQAIFYESQWVRANAGGLLISQVALGEPVEPGQCLGIVVDPVRNVERRIESPIHGRVIGMARNQVVLPGFAAFHIGEATSAERASDAAASGLVEEVVEEDPDPAMERDAEL